MVSRTFPVYHPKSGQPIYFVEKILNCIDKHNRWFAECEKCGWIGSSLVMNGGGQIADTGDYSDAYCPKCHSIHFNDIDGLEDEYYIGKFQPKLHTIRAGNRWEVGDMASLRYWDGKPYQSKQVEFAQVEVKKVWPIEIIPVKTGDSTASIDFFINGAKIEKDVLHSLAESDGLTTDDLIDWFIPEGTKFIVGVPIFTGQIICWSDKVNY